MSQQTFYRDQIRQIIKQKTRPLILLSHSFEYPQMSRFHGSNGHCLSVILVMTLDYECSNLVYQTHRPEGTQCS